MMESGVGYIIMFIVLVIIPIILLPFAVIWALNTLFHTNIAYGFCEWAAVVVIIIALGTAVKVTRSRGG